MTNFKTSLSFYSISILTLTLVIMILLTGYSQAVTRTVTNLNDSGPGSLRDIIDNVANSGDDIVFDPSLAGGTINLNSGQYEIGIDLTITGPADDPITIDANQNSRIISVIDPVTLILSNLVFEDGLASGSVTIDGGAIDATDVSGVVIEINNCTFRDNTAECDAQEVCNARGGAIATFGSLTVIGSTFDGNTVRCSTSLGQCSAIGGAIFVVESEEPSITLVMENSTVCDNQSVCSGGNCSLSGGISIDTSGTSSINNTTFADNSNDCDGEFCLQEANTIDKQPPGTLNISNTIINNDEGAEDDNCSGNITDAGNNIQFPGGSCGFTIPTAEALLGPLADNGGITQTKAISENSPAFNAGNNETCEPTDQRGVIRPQGQNCDIGAYELVLVTRNIPTLSEWGLIAMAGLIGIAGLIFHRRRAVRA